MIGQVVVVGGLAVLAAVLWRQGAFGSSKTGGVRTEHRSIPREDTRRTDLHVRMGAGVLSLQGGAAGLLDADFVSNQPELEPEFVYRTNDGILEASITQPSGHLVMPTPHMRYEWHLRCADNVPATIDLEAGAGTTDIDLSTVPSSSCTCGPVPARVAPSSSRPNSNTSTCRQERGDSTSRSEARRLHRRTAVSIAASERCRYTYREPRRPAST